MIYINYWRNLAILQKNNAYFILFRSIHDVLKAEKLLKHRGFTFELVPVPRNLSSDCGMCIRAEDVTDGLLACLGSMIISKCFCFDGTAYKEEEDLFLPTSR
jgi:hypothetical protein